MRAHLKSVPSTPNNWDQVYRDHHPRIARLCRMMLSDDDEAQETAQEVFVRALDHYRADGAPDSWAAWLTRVAVNACHDRRRSGWWRWWYRRVDEFQDSDHQSPAPGAERVALGRELYRVVWSEFRKLPARQREVFILRHIEEYTTGEVAELLQLDPGTVKRHLFRAVQRLRAALKDHA
jgi:RNA polymerase sigma-70 factor (ECF subfamily)